MSDLSGIYQRCRAISMSKARAGVNSAGYHSDASSGDADDHAQADQSCDDVPQQQQKSNKMVLELENRLSGRTVRVQLLRMDVTDDASIDAAFRKVKRSLEQRGYPGLNTLINNAGILDVVRQCLGICSHGNGRRKIDGVQK